MIYVDANVLIRLVEGTPAARAPIESRLQPLKGASGFLCTSRLSRMECRTKPVRVNDAALLQLYEALFAGHELVVLEVTADVLEKATELSAGLNLKSPDAIHLATAIVAKATSFLTGDRSLARCKEVSVEIL